ncbi:hypothetical protein ACWGOE_07270 [Leucobacter chromiiresistens]
MGERGQYAAVEAAVVNYLFDRRGGVEVATEVPNPMPERFIKVDRTGGRRTNKVTERVQLTVLVWAPTKTEASDLAQEARGDLDELDSVDGVSVYLLEEVGGPTSDPDPDRSSPRYLFTVALYLRTALTRAP